MNTQIHPGQTWEHATFGEVHVDKVEYDCNGKPFWLVTKTRLDENPFGATRQPVGTQMYACDVTKFKHLAPFAIA